MTDYTAYVGRLYMHYRGGLYTIKMIASGAGRLKDEPFFVYESVETNAIYCRPCRDFLTNVITEGLPIERFKPVNLD